MVRGFDEVFYAPHSRHTELCREEVDACPALRVLAESGRAGLHILATDSGRQIFVCGHMAVSYTHLRQQRPHRLWISGALQRLTVLQQYAHPVFGILQLLSLIHI